MSDGNYERIVEKISKASGLEKEEIERKIEAKSAKLSGLISKEGAAQVIASELGISFENERLKINELLLGMRKVNTIGKVINLFPVRTFTTKKGEESKVVNFWIADETSNVKVVLWDTNHIGMIESGKIAVGTTVEISNGSMRDNELHLGSFSDIKLSAESLGEVKTEKVFKEKHIIDFKVGENTSVRAFILQLFEPRFFYVCPECSKKAVQEGESFSCAKHGKVIPEKRAVSSLVVDDGTDSIRAVLFHEALLKLGFSQLEDLSRFAEEKENFLGKEMIFTGNIRNNAFFNTSEFVVEDVREADPDAVIAELEKQ
jgi:ssDNA-binding replication factor A large subunit